ncbi:MAG: hypothetical protein ACE5ES_05595 [Candidatus Nanoarchaeia archaeon]
MAKPAFSAKPYFTFSIQELSDKDRVAEITSDRKGDTDKLWYVIFFAPEILNKDENEISRTILHELLHVVEWEYNIVVEECLDKIGEISGWCSAALANLKEKQRERMIIHFEHIIWNAVNNK